MDQDDRGAPIYIWPSVGGGTTHVFSMLFDFWDTGQLTPVYLFDSGHTFTDEFLVVPEIGVTQEEVLHMATSAGDWEPAEQAARAKGWNVYTAAGTPYDHKGIINISLARIHNASYLLYSASLGNVDPTTVLMKPQRGGKLKTICVFQEVRAHL